MLDLAADAGLDHPSYYDEVKARADRELDNIRVDDAWYLGADVLDALAAGYDTVAVPCAEGCLGPQRIGRDALEAVERIHPNADVTILDFTAPDTEREQALGALFARMEKKRA